MFSFRGQSAKCLFFTYSPLSKKKLAWCIFSNPPTYTECFETHSRWSLWTVSSGRLTLPDDSQPRRMGGGKKKEKGNWQTVEQVAPTDGWNVTQNGRAGNRDYGSNIRNWLWMVMMRMQSLDSPIWACFLRLDRGDDTAAPPLWRWLTSQRWSLCWQSTDLGAAEWQVVLYFIF